jgi:hypothetical protein
MDIMGVVIGSGGVITLPLSPYNTEALPGVAKKSRSNPSLT